MDPTNAPDSAERKYLTPKRITAIVILLFLLQGLALWGLVQFSISQGALVATSAGLTTRIRELQEEKASREQANRVAFAALQADLDAQKKLLSDLGDQVAAERRKLDAARAETQPVTQELQKLKEEVARASAEAEEKHQAATLAVDRADSARRESEELEKKKAALQSEIGKLTAALPAAKEEQEAAKAAVAEIAQRRDAATEALGRLRGELEQLEKSIATTREALAASTQERAAADAAAETSRKARVVTDRELDSAKAALDSIKAERAALAGEVEKLRESKTLLSGLLAQKGELEKQRDALLGEVSALEKTVGGLRQDLAALTVSGESSEGVASALRTARSTLAEEVKQTTLELERLGDLRRQVKTLQNDQSTSPSTPQGTPLVGGSAQ